MTPDELRYYILYESDDIIIINKPAGLLVHLVAEDSIALTQFLPLIDPALRPAHRLDRETSGCLVCGRGPAALKKLGQLFMQRRIEKTYLALISGTPATEAGTINAPLLKQNARMIVDNTGAEAVTEWKLLEKRDGQSLLELKPLTGRTHQLRAHMQHLAHPIIGDKFYGGAEAPRLMLHAAAITIPGIATVKSAPDF